MSGVTAIVLLLCFPRYGYGVASSRRDMSIPASFWLKGESCDPCARLTFVDAEDKSVTVERWRDAWYMDTIQLCTQRSQDNWEKITVKIEENSILVGVQMWLQWPIVTILALPRSILSLRLYLPASTKAVEVNPTPDNWLECAHECTETCSGPSANDCTGLLAYNTQPVIVNRKVTKRDWTVTWWVEASRPKTKYAQITTVSCLEGRNADTSCEGLYVVSREFELQLCEFAGKRTECSQNMPLNGRSRVQFSYSKDQLSICVTTSQGSNCTQLPHSLFQAQSVLVQEVSNYTTGRELMWSYEPLKDQERGPFGIVRQLLVSHYASWASRRTIPANGIHYFTFFNTHISTTRIRFELSNTSPRQDLYVYKPFSDIEDWKDTGGGIRLVTLTPTNPKIISKGGVMTGSYTIKVTNPHFTTNTYDIEVLIECQEPSTACACPTSSFPDPDTAHCSACPVGDSNCGNISTLGCISVTEGSRLVLGTFNCETCYPTSNFLSQTSGSCTSCDVSCASCTVSGSNNCLSCAYAGTSLATSPGPSACVCNAGTYPNPSLSSCGSCHLTCFTCNTTGISKCTGCKPNASLSGASPNTCVCNAGYLGTPDNCLACDPSCATCSALTVSSCLTCKIHANLIGPSPNACQCAAGYYGDPEDCYLTCDPECATCSGSTNTRCTGCVATIAKLSSASPSSCVCSDGYFGTPPSCVLCNATCLTCAGAGTGQCITCKMNAIIASSPPGACACNIGFFPTPDSSNCKQCSPSCLTCSSPAATKCTDCKPNASLLNGANPGSCICNIGYYPNTTPENCQACDITCLECNGGAASQCKSCKANATLSGTTCVCQSGFSWDTVSALCQMCDATCLHCLDATASSCLDCWPHAVLSPVIGPGRCECQPGFFPSTTARTCAQCHSTCQSCSNNNASGCLSCYDFAQLSGTACVCIDKAYANPDAASCQLCHISCKSCTGPMESECSSCENGGYMRGPAPNICICGPGFFPNPNPSQCSPCLPVCATCRDSMTCTSCNSHAILNAELLCECVPGSFGQPDSSNCVLCASTCKSCYDLGCSDCLPGYYQLDGTCYDSCPIGYAETSDRICAAADMSAPIPTLTVLQNNTLAVSFDRPMNFILSSTDLDIDVLTSNGDLSPITWSEPSFQGADNFTITLHFQASYLPPGSQANLTFLSPSLILSAQQIPLSLPYVTATLEAFGTQPSNQTSLQSSSSAKQAAAAAGGVVATSAITSIVSGPSGFLSLVNQLQLVTYLSMTKIPIAQGFAGTLSALNVGSMLSNPLKDYLDTNITLGEAVAPPDYIENYGIETVLFLTNAAVFLGATGLILASYIPTYLLTKSSNATISTYCRNRMKSLTFSTPLKAWFTSYLDLCVFSLLQVSQVRVSLVSPYAWVSVLLATVFVVLTWITPFVLIVFTAKYYKIMIERKDEQFNTRWGALFMDFAKSEKVAVLAFYSVFIIRRLLLAAMLVLLPSYVSLFVILNCSFSVISVLYILISKPYEGKLDQYEAVVIEIGTALIYLLAGSFALTLTDKARSSLDRVGIWAVRSLIAASSFFSLLRCGVAVGIVIKRYVKAKQAVKARYALRELKE